MSLILILPGHSRAACYR